MNSMTNMAEYGKKPHTALAERIFFPLTKKMLPLQRQNMSGTAFFTMMTGIINKERKRSFSAPFATSNRQRISSNLFS
ncbi:hypothetical protein DWW55_16935 [Paraprevotella clara]|jgi:hypothetical protein|nr:hypothetical protein DWW55_16935 [Paraprevotella clara]